MAFFFMPANIFSQLFNLTLGIIMAGNNATSEVGCFNHFEDLKNVLRFAECSI